MIDLVKAEAKLKEVFSLKCHPVGLVYQDDPEVGAIRDQKFVCMAMQRALNGKVINLSADTMACNGGMHWLGLKRQKPLIISFLVLAERCFKNKKVAREWFDSVPTPPFGMGKYVMMKPLHLFKRMPEIIFIKCNSAQAYRILTVLNYSDASWSYPFQFMSTCQAMINALVLDHPTLVIPDTFSREIARFSENDLLVSIPASRLPIFLQDIDHSSGGTAPMVFSTKNILKEVFKKK